MLTSRHLLSLAFLARSGLGVPCVCCPLGWHWLPSVCGLASLACVVARPALAVSPRCAWPLRPCWVCPALVALVRWGLAVLACLWALRPAALPWCALHLRPLRVWLVLVTFVQWSVGLGRRGCSPCAGGLASVCHGVAALWGLFGRGCPCAFAAWWCWLKLAFALRPCLGVPSTCDLCWSVGVGYPCVRAGCVGLPPARGLASVCLANYNPVGFVWLRLPLCVLACGVGLPRAPCTLRPRLGVPATCGPCGLAGAGYPCAVACLCLPALCNLSCGPWWSSVWTAARILTPKKTKKQKERGWPSVLPRLARLVSCGPALVCLPLRPLWSCWGWFPLCGGLSGPAGSVRVSCGPLWSGVRTATSVYCQYESKIVGTQFMCCRF